MERMGSGETFMATKGGRTIRLTPVDENTHITDHPARSGMEALTDQKLFAQRIRSERASAYWFAASLWGVTGLALGAAMGVILTLMVQDNSEGRIAERTRDNIVTGMAVQDANDTVRDRPSLLSDEQEKQQPRP
jgi:hypothetical protein